VSGDLLLSEEWPTAWEPFTVEVQPDGDCLVLVAAGHLDEWTAGALLRNLIAVCDPAYEEVHLDLRAVQGAENALAVVDRCRAFAAERSVTLRVSTNRAIETGDLPSGLPAAGW
jgi:hypothetical protein